MSTSCEMDSDKILEKGQMDAPPLKIRVRVQVVENDLDLDKDILNLNHQFGCPPPKNYGRFWPKKAF